MAVGIGVYNFSWRDMGVPTLHKMLDIVQVSDDQTLSLLFSKCRSMCSMNSHCPSASLACCIAVQVMAHVIDVEKRRIAVHCHAGLGRTGYV